MKLPLYAALPMLLATPAVSGTLTTLHTFLPGTAPGGSLVLASQNGYDVFYGVSQAGGYGQVYRFRFTSAGTGFSVLWRFAPGAVGIYAGGLSGTPAQFFGATGANRIGENYGCGSVFRLTQAASGQYAAAPLANLNNNNKGCYPNAPVNVATNGDVFALFPSGGTNQGGYGSIVRFHPLNSIHTKWSEELLYSFQGKADGIYPTQPMLLGASGALYGTAIASSNGKAFPTPVWQLSPPAPHETLWHFSLIHQFSGRNECADGIGQLIQGADGTIYGPCKQTQNGTKDQYGNIFSLTPPASGQGRWAYTKLYTFEGQGDGAYPLNALALDQYGNLYGTTSKNHGTVFELLAPTSTNPSWQLHTLYTFGGADGDHPSSPLIVTSDLMLLGTTAAGGSTNGGTLFDLVP